MTGRPTTYTAELGERICLLLAEGKSLAKICTLDDTPSRSTVLLWVIKGWRGDERYKAFSDDYACAREAQAEAHADDLVDISDDDSGDYGFAEKEDGEGISASPVFIKENVLRSKLRVDTRKWVASRILKSKYGDHVTQKIDATVETYALTESERAARLAAIFDAAATARAGQPADGADEVGATDGSTDEGAE